MKEGSHVTMTTIIREKFDYLYLQIRKLRLRVVNYLAQGHTARCAE